MNEGIEFSADWPARMQWTPPMNGEVDDGDPEIQLR